MSDNILDKIKNAEPISADDVKKSTEGLKTLNEGYVKNQFTIETSTDNANTKKENNCE